MRIFRESEVNRMFRDAQVNSPFQGIMYGDKAYTAWTHARGLYKGAALEDWQNASNNAMSPVRTGAEWPFGNLNTKCKFLTFSQQQKLCESAIGHFYLVGVPCRGSGVSRPKVSILIVADLSSASVISSLPVRE